MRARNSARAATVVVAAVVALAVLGVAVFLAVSRKEAYTARPCHTRYALVYGNLRSSGEWSNPYTDTNPTRTIALAFVLPDEPRPPSSDEPYGLPRYGGLKATLSDKRPGGIWYAKPGEVWQVQVRTTSDGTAIVCQNAPPKKAQDWCTGNLPVCDRMSGDLDMLRKSRRIFDENFQPPK